jgi:hypothetical protein
MPAGFHPEKKVAKLGEAAEPAVLGGEYPPLDKETHVASNNTHAAN